MPKLIAVIEAEASAGSGVRNSPYRTVKQIYHTDGELIAELDPCSVTIEEIFRAYKDAGSLEFHELLDLLKL